MGLNKPVDFTTAKLLKEKGFDKRPFYLKSDTDKIEDNKTELLEAKRKLYLLLLNLNEDDITDNELDIMLFLSRDEQIQSILK